MVDFFALVTTVSIHARSRAGDAYLKVCNLKLKVSIHARSRAGDAMLITIGVGNLLFQSTPAHERATKHCKRQSRPERFQSTPAHERATRTSTERTSTERFQSTPAHERATAASSLEVLMISVSIHARSRAGDFS